MPTTPLKQLQNLLEFTDEDLTANRKGRLSASQVDFLRRKAMHELNAVLVVPFGIAVIALSALSLEMAFPVVIVIGLIMAALYSFHRQKLEDIPYKSLEVVQGRLTKLPKTASVTHHAVSLNGEKFAVDRDFYHQILEGDYTFYLLGETRQIFGIEPGKKGVSAPTSTTTRKAIPAKASTTAPKATPTRAATATKPKTTAPKSAGRTTTAPAAKPASPKPASTASTSTRKPASSSPKVNEFGFSEKPAKPKGVVDKSAKTTTATRSAAAKPASTGRR